MRILVAPDKFKGSLSAAEAAEQIAVGLREALPHAEITLLPIADGGEGTATVICAASGGEWISCEAHDAMGNIVAARYCMISSGKTAIMEMSEASGLWRIPPESRDPKVASSFGTGEMLLDAARRGVDEVIIGLGGSATNDGGFGMARALGFRFLDANNEELRGPVSDLLRLAKVEQSEDLRLPKMTAASDVRNPLLGARGATRIFGPQKGVMPQEIELLERALKRLADVIARDFGFDYRELPGSGAAGGLGFGLKNFCSAELRSGFDVVAEAIDLENAICNTDVVITGEGRLDAQTLEGKAPAGAAQLARKYGKPIYAIVGVAGREPELTRIFDGVALLAEPPLTVEKAMMHAPELLQLRAREVARRLLERRSVGS